MTLFRRALEEARGILDGSDNLADLVQQRGGELRVAFAGGGRRRAVTLDRAMQQDAVWSSTSFIADPLSVIDPGTFAPTSVDGRTVRRPVPTPQIVGSPSGTFDRIQWRRQVYMSWLLRGNAVGVVSGMSGGFPTSIELLHPDEFTASRTRSGDWEFRLGGEKVRRWPDGDIWHVPVLTMPGHPLGLSVIRYAAASIGRALMADEFGADYFAQDISPQAVLESDQPIDNVQAGVLKQRAKEAVSGRDLLVLGRGAKWKPIAVSPEESQFLATVGADRGRIASWFRVPGSEIGAPTGDSLTYSSPEQNGKRLTAYTFRPWSRLLDAALTSLLPRGQFVETPLDELHPVSKLDQARVDDIEVRGGWKSPDDVRDGHGLAPIAGDSGDQYLWPPYSTSPVAPVPSTEESPNVSP